MPGDNARCELALIGTGLAPLVAATRLAASGRDVVVLNPDGDFFLERSELPFDPLWPPQALAERLVAQLPENALAALAPYFPGSIESYPSAVPGFHDPTAPHVRSRERIWLPGRWRPAGDVPPSRRRGELGFATARSSETEIDRPAIDRAGDRGSIEELFLRADEAGLRPLFMDGFVASMRFPGSARRASEGNEGESGLVLPRVADVDVARYGNGVLAFVTERLGADRVRAGVDGMRVDGNELSFWHDGKNHSIRVERAVLAFWTPRLNGWIERQTQLAKGKIAGPPFARVWHEWTLVSREAVAPDVIGSCGGLTFWADYEGRPPEGGSREIKVLQAGGKVSWDGSGTFPMGDSVANPELLSELTGVSGRILGWERLSIRRMRVRAILEWEGAVPEPFAHGLLRIVPASDGPIFEVARRASRAAELAEAT